MFRQQSVHGRLLSRRDLQRRGRLPGLVDVQRLPIGQL
jgi:hypothetical protein